MFLIRRGAGSDGRWGVVLIGWHGFFQGFLIRGSDVSGRMRCVKSATLVLVLAILGSSCHVRRAARQGGGHALQHLWVDSSVGALSDGSRSYPFPSPQMAVAAAGGLPARIHLAPGTYAGPLELTP